MTFLNRKETEAILLAYSDLQPGTSFRHPDAAKAIRKRKHRYQEVPYPKNSDGTKNSGITRTIQRISAIRAIEFFEITDIGSPGPAKEVTTRIQTNIRTEQALPLEGRKLVFRPGRRRLIISPPTLCELGTATPRRRSQDAESKQNII